MLNIISGYEREHYIVESINFSKITASVKHGNIRLIARDVIIFDCIDDFSMQVCGPINSNFTHWSIKINTSINQLLDCKLANKWLEIFHSLESEYLYRGDKEMSSGEKVVLSFMRFLPHGIGVSIY